MNTTITVSQLNRYVKARLDEDYRLQDLLLSGEISNFNNHYRSGHFYFVLKDKDAAVHAVMFRSNAQSLRFLPADGMKVVVRCSVSLYERDGSYQVYVREMFPDGAGALYLAFEQLKAKLSKEGLFDETRKRELPRYPQTVGIVTSPTGAAVQDMINILSRRWPLCEVRFAPATVQGDGAAGSIIAALRALTGEGKSELIIVGRGGGSFEDLFCFNDEALAREIYRCPVPVISAVGHETDYTICDFVADLRAPTPSAAAELAVPDMREVCFLLGNLEASMGDTLGRKLKGYESRLQNAAALAHSHAPMARLREAQQRVDSLGERLRAQMAQQMRLRRERLHAQGALIESLSPLRTLARGYSVLKKEGEGVRSVSQVRRGDALTAFLADGQLSLTVEEIKKTKARTGLGG
ncbi:exodeoxyribonuclease VII large subunit [Harryflintia acetispora]|uniref:exodeoxyribonuclease VII large subunit n=1 Tax=Harryflintia acetispora TaxID=1849041 RepID=UPI00189825CD|nr:exodeoxyribonuclease VII large subunit [Harryflintia acetispora]